MQEKNSGGPSELLLIVAIPACLGFKAFPGPVRLPPRMQPIGRSHLMARLAMSPCASQQHSQDRAGSLPARSYSCNPADGGGGGGS
jgi:hypothetical protein